MSKNSKMYVEKLYKSIPITEKAEIRVVTTKEVPTQNMMIDIRKYALYGGGYDGLKKATKQGIKFKIWNIPNIIIGLTDILEYYGILDEDSCEQVKRIMKMRCVIDRR